MLQGLGALLAVALVGALIVNIRAAATEVGAARALVRIAAVDRQVFAIMQALRKQRGDVQTAVLSLDAPLQKAEPIATEAAAGLRKALAAAEIDDLADATPLLRSIEDRQQAVELRWPDIVALAGQPKAQRRVDRTLGWYHAVGAVVDGLEALTATTAGRIRITDALAGEQVTIRQMAWRFRSVVGDECSLMRGAVAAGQPISPDLRERLDRVRGAQSAVAALIEEMAERPGIAPEMLASTAAAKAAYRDARAARDLVYRQLDDPAAPRSSPEGWTRLCDAPFAPVLQIAQSAIDLIERHAGERLSGARRRIWLSGAVLAAALGFTALGAWVVRRRFIQPVTDLTAAIGHLSQRNFTIPVRKPGHEDEFSVMARTLEMLRLGAVEAEAAAAVHEADQQAALDRAAALLALCRRFEAETGSTLRTVGTAIAGMTEAADAMAAATGAAGAQTATIAAAVEQTIASIAQVASAAAQVRAAVSDIARQVGQSAALSREAVGEAEATTAGVSRLSDAAVEIGAVIDTISAIAARTNLLALNATIEAARAGEAGKGFAVVASEVKALANQTAAATRQIDEKVKLIQVATLQAVSSIGGIGLRIRRIDDIAAAIAVSVVQQDGAIGHLAQEADAVSRASAEVSSRLADMRATADRTAGEAATMRGEAGGAAAQSQALAGQIEGFIAQLGEGSAAA
jgi:methyl-accepting chemotaxis protein